MQHNYIYYHYYGSKKNCFFVIQFVSLTVLHEQFMLLITLVLRLLVLWLLQYYFVISYVNDMEMFGIMVGKNSFAECAL